MSFLKLKKTFKFFREKNKNYYFFALIRERKEEITECVGMVRNAKSFYFYFYFFFYLSSDVEPEAINWSRRSWKSIVDRKSREVEKSVGRQ